ncbi:NADH-quinone oxidoreductase subunit N [Hugenholtzia roseola]|uniref:NADH-quinone oxidoreductase subunit N n=1 Tax=Hugenholtzia roseola TaxID=1002 RepID=UPI0003FEAB1B|nr:proton-conducting transporter membrane subunit [Hugenholtzia roseola]
MSEFSAALPRLIEDLPFFYSEIGLSLAFILLLVGIVLNGSDKKLAFFTFFCFLCNLLFLGLELENSLSAPSFSFGNRFVHSPLETKAKLLLSAISAVSVWLFWADRRLRKGRGERYLVLMALQLLGQFALMSVDFMAFFVAFEALSLLLYGLVATSKDKNSSRIALQYLLFGAVASALMLYGASLLYARYRSFEVGIWLAALKEGESATTLIPFLLFYIGFFFKLSLVPFHFWSPDVYEKTATSLVAYLSIFPKIVALLAFWHFYLPDNQILLYFIIWIGLLSMFWGNIGALLQTQLKRLMAYSGIAHSGFWLLALALHQKNNLESLIFYVFIYTLLNLGFFIWLLIEERRGFKGDLKETFIFEKRWTAFAVLVALIGLVGLPPTAGFSAKLLLFSAFWEQVADKENYFLQVVFALGLLNTPLGLFFYLKIPYHIFIKKKETPNPHLAKWQAHFAAKRSAFYWIGSGVLVGIALLVLLFFVKIDWLF